MTNALPQAWQELETRSDLSSDQLLRLFRFFHEEATTYLTVCLQEQAAVDHLRRIAYEGVDAEDWDPPEEADLLHTEPYGELVRLLMDAEYTETAALPEAQAVQHIRSCLQQLRSIFARLRADAFSHRVYLTGKQALFNELAFEELGVFATLEDTLSDLDDPYRDWSVQDILRYESCMDTLLESMDRDWWEDQESPLAEIGHMIFHQVDDVMQQLQDDPSQEHWTELQPQVDALLQVEAWFRTHPPEKYPTETRLRKRGFYARDKAFTQAEEMLGAMDATPAQQTAYETFEAAAYAFQRMVLNDLLEANGADIRLQAPSESEANAQVDAALDGAKRAYTSPSVST